MSRGLQRIFNSTASTYEMINHILTFGLDKLWRRKIAELALINGGSKWLDVCSGTGEMAANLQSVSKHDMIILSTDFSFAMLKEGQKKVEFQNIPQILAESGSLPFKDNLFDVVTISYATRNLNPTRDRLISYLKEFHRILKPGGIFLNLETSQPESFILRHLFHIYARHVVANLGHLISGSRSGYAYLASSVQRFYDRTEFARILHQAGFKKIKVKSFLLGAFAVHQAMA